MTIQLPSDEPIPAGDMKILPVEADDDDGFARAPEPRPDENVVERVGSIHMPLRGIVEENEEEA